MSGAILHPNRETDEELTRVLEPVTSYICASERPRLTLIAALSALCREVRETTHDATHHLAALPREKGS